VNINDPTRRHDFAFVFDVQDGNPNGDPDGNNLPRTGPETEQGIVTDVCLKRKVRDYVVLASDNRIYVEHKGVSSPQAPASGRRVGWLWGPRRGRRRAGQQPHTC
jgi:CRISPR/Cas system type I-B associated protein Csh2 (Cas7 group RAMP superfamily)